MTQPDTKNDRELAEHAVLLRTVAQGDQFLQGGDRFWQLLLVRGDHFWWGTGFCVTGHRDALLELDQLE